MAMFVSGSSSSTGSLAKLELYSSAQTGSNVLTVDGTQGRLFSVIDEMSGSIFSANTIAGLPVIEAFSNNEVNLGPYSSPVHIDSSGKVGIGTASPGDKLHIVGGGIKLVGASYASSITLAGTDGVTDGALYSVNNTIGFLDAGGDWTIRAVNDDRIDFSTAGDTKHMTILNSGNVGIGTTAPIDLLHVRNGSILIEKDTDTAGHQAILYFKVDSQDTDARKKGAIIFQRNGTRGAGDMYLCVDGVNDDGQASIADTKLFLSGSGQVGIGTSSPAVNLHVENGSAGGTPTALAGTVQIIENSNNAYLTFLTPNDKQGGILMGDEDSGYQAAIVYQHSTGKMLIDTAATTKMTIQSDGNVGIGNTAPPSPLTVEGNISGSGYIYLNDRLYMNNDLYLLRVGSQMGVGFDNDIAQITYGKDQTDTIHNFYGHKISGSNISTGSFGKLETSGDVQTGGTFMASDGSVGLTTTKEYETADDYHLVTLKDGLITGWDISAK